MSDRVEIKARKILAEGHGTLASTTFAYRRRDGRSQTLVRETYGRGNGATVLPIDPARGTVLLVRQFRFPIHTLGDDAMLIETIAGLLDAQSPEEAIVREAEEEAGVALSDLARVFDIHTSPGVVAERIACYVARYDAGATRTETGGLFEEGEDIEVLEFGLDEALSMTADGRITDAKTILLLQHARLSGLA